MTSIRAVLAGILLIAGCHSTATQVSTESVATRAATAYPKNIIFLISDGCGPASFTMARQFVQSRGGSDLAVDPLLVGAVSTQSASNLIVDSAASATALACGVNTNNGAIAVDTAGRPVATILEAAESLGRATGLVATSTITHATPASFSAHVLSRSDQDSVALQQMEQQIEVVLGGGADYYLPADRGGRRSDSRDLLAEAASRGYQVVRSRQDLMSVTEVPVIGLFSGSHMSYEIDRDRDIQPSLAEMTVRAIDLLARDPDGFFLMVEGSRIDHAGHGNDAPAHLFDILAFDEAVARAVEFARENGETLVISTSDHETGGLSVGARVDGRSAYTWYPERLAEAEHSLEFVADSLLGRVPWNRVLEAVGIDDPTREELRMGADSTWSRQALADMMSERARIGWTTGGHTAVDVNMYAFGPGSELFAGHLDNTAIATKLAHLMGVDLADLTQRLRSAGGS